MIKIGHAAHNELGQVVGGKHGDQNGQEVYTTNWYYFGQTEVYRWKDEELAKTYAEYVKTCCANDNIGYGQDWRWMLNDFLCQNGFDINKITTPMDCDCSAFAGALINAVMKKAVVSGAVQTGTMEKYLMPTGLFEKLTDEKYCKADSFLKVGDIINCPFKHVVIALEDGDNKPFALSLDAKVLGTHKVGETLSAKDFVVTVKMSDGTERINPVGWSATPLTLKTAETKITVQYMAATQIIVVKAIDSNVPKSVAATVTGKHYIGDTLTAADFEIKVTMSNGQVLVNPQGWSATPLKLTSASNKIKVVYKNVSTYTVVKAENKPVALSASVKGQHKIGETLTAADFNIRVNMADGSVVMNPMYWSASPLKLSRADNFIIVSYKGISTTIAVKATK